MNVLAVDTSSECPSGVVMRGDEILAEVSEGSDLRHSESLFAALEHLLAESAIGLGAIDAFGAVRGPGSFTGIRVGLAAIEGLAFTHGKPTYGVSALEAIAWQQAPTGNPIVVPLVDARRGRFYGAIYRRDELGLTIVAEPAIREAREWLAMAPESGTVFAGVGAMRLESDIARIPGASLGPAGGALATTVARLIANGKGETMTPFYLEQTSAEKNLQGTGR